MGAGRIAREKIRVTIIKHYRVYVINKTNIDTATIHVAYSGILNMKSVKSPGFTFDNFKIAHSCVR